MPRQTRPKSPRKSAPVRRPGRPTGEQADQRERLLDAAVAHYANHGIANANLRSIAAQADVTPALIGYYFGGKEALLAAVIESRLLPTVGELRSALAANASPDVTTMAADFVREIHGVVRRHPWLPSLWIREIVTEGGALRALMLDSVAPHLPRAIAARFAQARARGELRPGIDPRLLTVSLIGLTLFPLASSSLWRQIFDAGDIDDSVLQSHTLALLNSALEKPHA